MSKENRILRKFEVTDVVIDVIEGVPMFELYSIGMALGYANKRVSKGKEYITPFKSRIAKVLKNAEIKGLCRGDTTYLTENQVYDFMLEAHTNKCKSFRRWLVDEVLPTLERTGAYFEAGREEEVIDHYFASISDDVKLLMLKDLQKAIKAEQENSRELREFYDDLLNTDDLYHTNMVAKELKIGRNTLLSYLRDKKVLFYQDNSNVPYQRFMNQGLFSVVETPCQDGKYRPVTYVTKKGLNYIRKMLRKDGYYNAITE